MTAQKVRAGGKKETSAPKRHRPVWQHDAMSQAFVREVDGERWQAPGEPCAYRVLDSQAEVVFESDDILQALRWLRRSQVPVVLQSREGAALAFSG